jgi:hypothetical protein
VNDHKGIVLVAPRKSGKTTAAQALVDIGFVRVGLADAVKDAAVRMLNALYRGPFYTGEDPLVFNKEHIERDKAVFRPLLEWLGTSFGRDYLRRPDRWIRMFEQKTRLMSDLVVCDDMRLPNEADELRKMGFLIVRVVRPEAERRAALIEAGEDPDAQMPSEIDIAQIAADVTVPNDGTPEELRNLMEIVALSIMR